MIETEFKKKLGWYNSFRLHFGAFAFSAHCFSMRCRSDLVQIHLTITSDHLLSGVLQLVVELVKFRLVCDILDVLGINLLIYI